MFESLYAEVLIVNWVTVFCSAILCCLVYVFIRNRNVNLPPGPAGLPVIGYFPFITSQPAKTFYELGKTHGDVVCVTAFNKNTICFNSYEVIKECFLEKGDQFSGKRDNIDDELAYISEATGFLREEGNTWREHRRFAQHTLRDFGFGKLSLEARVQEIGQDLLDFLQNTKGEPTNPRDLLANSTFNVILYLTTDKHYQHHDEDFVDIQKSIEVLFRFLSAGGFNIILKRLTRFLPNRWRFPKLVKVRDVFDKFIEKVLREHEDTLDENNPRDYVDAFLIERNKAVKQGKAEETTFTEVDCVYSTCNVTGVDVVDAKVNRSLCYRLWRPNSGFADTAHRLKGNLIHLLIAGTETTSNTLYWMLRIVSHRQDIQERLHKELDDVVGRERLPSVLDRPSLPYTEAFILELLRYTTIIPLGGSHSNPAAAKLRGYDIPARSLLFGNLWGVHNDPTFWKDPERFDPERFMDPETKAKRRERVVPFGIGKRSCLGESLARMELFIFMTMLLQKFKFVLEEGDTGDLAMQNITIRTLQPYKIQAILRF